MPFQEDKTLKHLELLFSIGDDMYQQSLAIKEESDDPKVLLQAVKLEGEALMVKYLARNLQNDFKRLRDLERTIQKKTGPLGVNGPAEAELK